MIVSSSSASLPFLTSEDVMAELGELTSTSNELHEDFLQPIAF